MYNTYKGFYKATYKLSLIKNAKKQRINIKTNKEPKK
ncbi:hypothetical protein SCG7109_AK_00230 [Chlamydiales bacterium SCGC AG-110-M15]|nr:hypothetical protein SCG7109_AK_00230 [Chlamydiales bacterium SCGC AG-110-M15]